jgi:putative Mg2+ transporter-C (MgtC) family protein
MLLLEIPSLSWEEELLRVAVAAALGGAVGLERELRDREAGFRTHMLVAVGSALFTLVSAYGFRDFLVHGGTVVRADPTRIAAQIVTGIGFLGAGAIIRQGLSIRGLTTAATLWVVAAIGLAAGAGYYSAAVITTLLALFSLGPLRGAAHVFTSRLTAT